MRRRTLLKVGLAGGSLLALAGGTLALLQPGRIDGRLSDNARTMLSAVSRAVLDSLLPADASASQSAIGGLLKRLEDTVAALPPALQAEVDEMLTIVASTPGRIALMGLTTAWGQASNADVVRALQGLRESRLALRQQVFHALRDLCNVAYFADSSTWPLVGYPGQRPVTTAPASAPVGTRP
jgi:hypothetical protein